MREITFTFDTKKRLYAVFVIILIDTFVMPAVYSMVILPVLKTSAPHAEITDMLTNLSLKDMPFVFALSFITFLVWLLPFGIMHSIMLFFLMPICKPKNIFLCSIAGIVILIAFSFDWANMLSTAHFTFEWSRIWMYILPVIVNTALFCQIMQKKERME